MLRNGADACLCNCPVSAQQFAALTEVLFRFLTEPKEVSKERGGHPGEGCECSSGEKHAEIKSCPSS